MSWDVCLKGYFRGGCRKEQERETLPHSASWKLETGHKEGRNVTQRIVLWYKRPSRRSMRPVHPFVFQGTEGEGGQMSVNVWIYQSESKVGK